jgi:hypothetical protein
VQKVEGNKSDLLDFKIVFEFRVFGEHEILLLECFAPGGPSDITSQ